MQTKLPFLRSEFSELEHFPPEERTAVLDRCVAAESMDKISRRHMLIGRINLLTLAAVVAVHFLFSPSIFDRRLHYHILVGVLVTFVVVFIANVLFYFWSSSNEMHRLICEELNKPTNANV